MGRVGDRMGKNGKVLFDRPKLTAGRSANGRRIFSTQDELRDVCCRYCFNAAFARDVF